MRTTKRIAVKMAVSFVTLMIVCTLFSRTVYYWTTPKVLTKTPFAGSIKYAYAPQAIFWHSSNPQPVTLDFALSTPLKVSELLAHVGDSIESGQPLVRFDPAYGQQMLADARAAQADAQTAIAVWDRQYEAEEAQLRLELLNLSREMTTANRNARHALEIRLAEAQAALDFLTHAQTCGGISRSSLERTLAESDAAIHCLTVLSDADWVVAAPVTGRVIWVDPVILSGGYDGISTFATISPVGDHMMIACEVTDIPTYFSDFDQVNVTVYDAPYQDLEMHVACFDPQDRRLYLESTPPEDLSAMPALPVDIMFSIQGTYCKTLVPNSALVGDWLYILECQEGFFGTELIARRIKVQLGANDALNTAVLSGLTGSEEVVVNWDRSLSDGIRVTKFIH